jgi:hypothetical protein
VKWISHPNPDNNSQTGEASNRVGDSGLSRAIGEDPSAVHRDGLKQTFGIGSQTQVCLSLPFGLNLATQDLDLRVAFNHAGWTLSNHSKNYERVVMTAQPEDRSIVQGAAPRSSICRFAKTNAPTCIVGPEKRGGGLFGKDSESGCCDISDILHICAQISTSFRFQFNQKLLELIGR